MRNSVRRIGLGRMLVAAILVAVPAAAQQTIPGLENFSIERPAPPPVVTPSPTPTTATPAPTPAPAVASPTPAPATATPAPVASPSPTPRATPRAETVEPSPLPSAPGATATLTPPPAADASPAPEGGAAVPPPASAPTDRGAGWPLWLLIAFGAAVLAGGGWWLFNRRAAVAHGEGPVATVPEPTPPPRADPPAAPLPAAPPPAVPPVAPPPAVPPAVAPRAGPSRQVTVPASSLPAGLVTTAAPKPPGGLVTTAFRPEPVFDLTPVRAGIDTLRATLEFSLAIGNQGRAPAHDMFVEAWLLAADRDPRSLIGDLLALEPGEPVLPPFALPPGGAIDVSGQVSTPRDALAAITAGERKLFVPMLVVRALWHDGGGRRDGTGAAFMVGVPREGQDRLAPLPLDRGARGYTTLAALRFDG